MKRLTQLVALSGVLAVLVGCGTCTGGAPTCDAVDEPNLDLVAMSRVCDIEPCESVGELGIAEDAVTLRVFDDQGNEWLVTWER